MSISFYLCLLIAYLVYGNDMVYGFPHSRLPFGLNLFSSGYMGYKPQKNVTDDIAFLVGWPEAESTVSLRDNARDEREDNQQMSLDKSFIDFFDWRTDVAVLSETSSSAEMENNVDLLKDQQRILSGQQNLNAPVDNANLSLVAGNEKFASPSYPKPLLPRNEVVPHVSLGPPARLRPAYGINKNKKARHFLNSNYVSQFHSVPGNGGEGLTIMQYDPYQPRLLGGTYLYPALTKSPAIMINWLNETPLIKSVELGFPGPDHLLNPYQFPISFPYQLKYQKLEGNIESVTTSSSLLPSSSQNSTVDFTIPTSHILPSTIKPVVNATFIPFYAAPQFWGGFNNHSFKYEDYHGKNELPKFLGFPFSILPIQIETAAVTEPSSAAVSLLKTTETVSNTPDTTLRIPFVLHLNEVSVPNTEQRSNMQYVNISNQDSALRFGNVVVNGFNVDQSFFQRSSPASVALLVQSREGNTSILIQVLQPPLPMATTHRIGAGALRNKTGLPSHYSLQPALQFQTQKETTSSATGTFDVAKLGITTVVANEFQLTPPTPKSMLLDRDHRSTLPSSKCTPMTTCSTKRHKTKMAHKTSKKCTTVSSTTPITTRSSSTVTKCTTKPTMCSATKSTTTACSTRTTMGTYLTTMLSTPDLGGRIQPTLAALNKTTLFSINSVDAQRVQSSIRDVLQRIICGNIGPTMKITEATTSHGVRVVPTSFTQAHYEVFTKTSEIMNPYTLKVKFITDLHTLAAEPSSDINGYYEKLVLDMIHQLETTADKGMNFMNNSALLIIPEDKQSIVSTSDSSLSSDQQIRNCIFPRPTTSPYMPYLEEDENWNYITF